VRRGEVYDAHLDPTEGSEQAGSRPIIIVSCDAINIASPVMLGVPCTTYRPGRRIYPSPVLLQVPKGGLTTDAVALGDPVRARAENRLGRWRGMLSAAALAEWDRALLIALDLPGQR
jgi:mRNA interferase MazF